MYLFISVRNSRLIITQIMTNSDLQSLETLIAAHEEIATHLNKFSTEDISINEVKVCVLLTRPTLTFG